MTPKYLKYLQSIPRDMRVKLDQALKDILALRFDHLDCKKLQGFSHIFRVRVGKYRIVFEKNDTRVTILEINTRGDVY